MATKMSKNDSIDKQFKELTNLLIQARTEKTNLVSLEEERNSITQKIEDTKTKIRDNEQVKRLKLLKRDLEKEIRKIDNRIQNSKTMLDNYHANADELNYKLRDYANSNGPVEVIIPPLETYDGR